MARKKDERIYIWVSSEQKEKLEAKASEAKRPLSHYLVSAAENSVIYKVEGLKDVAHELRKIGNNLNQLTHLTHIINLKSESARNTNSKKIPDFSQRLNDTKEGLDRIWRSLNLLIERTKI